MYVNFSSPNYLEVCGGVYKTPVQSFLHNWTLELKQAIYIYTLSSKKKHRKFGHQTLIGSNVVGFQKKPDLLKYYPVLENRRHFVSMGASLKQVNHTFVGHWKKTTYTNKQSGVYPDIPQKKVPKGMWVFKGSSQSWGIKHQPFMVDTTDPALPFSHSSALSMYTYPT